MKSQVISIAIFVAAIIGVVAVLQSNPFAGPSKKEVELQAKYEVATERAKQSFKEAAQLRLQAKALSSRLEQLQEELKTNKNTTNEAVNTIPLLLPDSLAGHIAEQLDYLNSAWY